MLIVVLLVTYDVYSIECLAQVFLVTSVFPRLNSKENLS